MRSQLYKYPPRQQQPNREDFANRERELTKVSTYTPGQWKNFIPHQIRQSSEKQLSRTPSYQSYKTFEANYELNDQEPNNSRIRSILISRKQEESRRQQSAMRKVRELQQKVLPLVRNNHFEEQGIWIGWQSRIQQKLLRLEGRMQNMKKQMQLQLQKRVVELQNKWQSRLNDYLKQTEQKQ